MNTPLELSQDFNDALDMMDKENKHLFITGRAGTGKSTLLRLFRKTSRKKIVVLAPTGIAALNVGGQTIHSFFGFPPRPLTSKDIKQVRSKQKLIQNIDTLIIDEISMVRADLLDGIDAFMRKNGRKPDLPFSGVQVIFFGDLFQLPPVVSSQTEKQFFQTYYDSPYFFSANVFKQDFEVEMVELRKTYRQDSRYFVRLLDAVRTNMLDYDDLAELNERHIPDFEPQEAYITLSTRNSVVDQINKKALDELHTPERIFFAEVVGKFEGRLFPTEQTLQLKLGAQVMFLKNDPKRKYVNGTIGRVVGFKDDAVKVEIERADGELIDINVEKSEWKILKYKTSSNLENEIETEVAGTFKQFPLKLAWAITIHKSQGKTFDRVIIDLGRGAFEHGQTYVALSRCRTLEGIVLKKPLRVRDIMVDERIVDFYERCL